MRMSHSGAARAGDTAYCLLAAKSLPSGVGDACECCGGDVQVRRRVSACCHAGRMWLLHQRTGWARWRTGAGWIGGLVTGSVPALGCGRDTLSDTLDFVGHQLRFGENHEVSGFFGEHVPGTETFGRAAVGGQERGADRAVP